jgi:pilus assembly protein FimV
VQTRNKKSGLFKAGVLALALSSTFVASQAWALTLGRLTAQSTVGQPLRATLEVPAISPDQAASLQIRVASPDRFAAASMVLNSVLNEARFELLPTTNGQTSIRIQTARPVNEPFLDLVLEFRWGGGQLVRTYTLLLDPPNLQTSRPQDAASVLAPALSANTAPIPRFEPLAPVSSAPATAPVSAPVNPEPNLVREVPQAPVSPVQEPTRVAETPPAPAAPNTGLVRELPSPRLTAPSPAPSASSPAPLVREVPTPSTETSTSLVREITEPTQTQAPATASRFAPVESTSVRVARGDTAARIAANHLPPGVSLDQMLVAMLQTNPQAFINGNVNLLRAGARIELPDFNEASQVTPQEARQLVRAQTRDFNEYRRRLAGVAPTQATPEAGQSITGRVQESVEVTTPAATEPDRLELSRGSVAEQQSTESIAQQRQEEDTQSRLSELDRNLKELEALAQAAGTNNQDGSTQGEGEPKTDLLAIQSDQAVANDAAASEQAPVEPAPELTAAEKAQSFVEQWLKHPWTVPLALLLIAVLGLLGWTRARAQRKQSAFKATSQTAAQSAVATAPSYTPEPARMPAAAKPTVGAATNDPISEAEVYLAYGMDDQAENLLRQALATNPSGLPERLKLLEVYQVRGDVLAFNTLAQEVFEITLGETEEWEQVARAGMKLDPSNPLYHPVHDGSRAAGELPADIKDLSLDLGSPNDGNPRQP